MKTLIHIFIIGTLAASNILASNTNTNDPPSSAEISDQRPPPLVAMFPGVKRSRFYIGSRYGRSPFKDTADPQTLSVVPRNNRFFTGSRYGKRSDERMQPVADQESSRKEGLPIGSVLMCRFTGVKDFYRCGSLEVNGMDNDVEATGA